MPFNAGQRLLASQLNNNMPQLLGSSILTATQPAITIPTTSAAAGVGVNGLQISWQARGDTAAAAINFMLQFNGDVGANYMWEINQANNAGVAGNSSGTAGAIQIGTIPAASATANFFGTGQTLVSNPLSTVAFKSCAGHATAAITSTNMYSGTYGGLWRSTVAVTSVTLLALTGNLVAGSMAAVYGL